MTERNDAPPSTNLPAVVTQDEASKQVTRAILDFVSQIRRPKRGDWPIARPSAPR